MESTGDTGVSYEEGLRLHPMVCWKSMKKSSSLRFDENDYLQCTLLCLNHMTPNGHFIGRTAPLNYRCCIFLFIQQIYVVNILNTLHTLRFFLFKMSFIS
jgi:hypothetical protein